MKSNKELTVLLNQLKKWHDSEGIGSEEQWSRRGVRLLHDLLSFDPDNSEYRYTLAKLLLAKGQDEKMQKRNYDAAYELFKEVLILQPDFFKAHYHLGSIEKSYRKWQEALDHFTKAISSPVLSNFERVFALCASSQCWIWLGEEQKAAEAIAVAKEHAKERTEQSHVELTEQALQMYNRPESAMNRRTNRTYVLITSTGESLITAEKAINAVDQALDEDFLVLDMRSRRPKFTGPHDTALLEPRAAEVLELLMQQNGYLSSRQIQQTIWPDSSNTSIVKRYINKLRKSLWPCFEKNTDEYIKNVPGSGYCWCSETPYRIIKLHV